MTRLKRPGGRGSWLASISELTFSSPPEREGGVPGYCRWPARLDGDMGLMGLMGSRGTLWVGVWGFPPAAPVINR